METPPPREPRRISPVLLGCGGVLLLLLLIAGTVATTIWWIQRPIRPVVLTAQEKVVVEEKLKELEGGSIPLTPSTPLPVAASTASPSPVVDERVYVPGSKTLQLTEREINGLLNQNTDLGDKVRFEFAQDAIHAYLAIPIPEDFPVGAGTTFRMRGRFRVSIGGEGKPYLVIEDVTVFGLSLPKEWLGGLKGENLLDQAFGETGGIQGIKNLRVEPGVLVLEVGD